MIEIPTQPVYYVAFFVTSFTSMEEVQAHAPEAIAAHVKRSRELHAQGTLLMAGALSNQSGEAVTTMGVFPSREAAEEYAAGDPFVRNGMVTTWSIREWANILTEPAASHG